MRAAIYVRVSTEDQARHGYSLEAQREACRRRALEAGAESVAEYADEGVSGSVLERPGLQALREACRAGMIDLVVCLDPDRLSRKLAHQLLLTEEFERRGVRLEFVNFDWRDTPDGRLLYAMRGAIAEYEREKIRERTLLGKKQKAKSGLLPVGAAPFGYRLQAGRLVPEPTEAETVRLIFRIFLAEDVGVNGVAARLASLGAPTRKGRPWNRCTVRGILRNPAYAGVFLYRQDGEALPIPVPPLVDPDVWAAAQEKMAEARRLWSGWSREDYLLSGLVTCADCGCSMHGAVRLRKEGRVRGYTCARTQAGGFKRGCRPIKYVDAGPLENAVWGQVKAWLDDPAAFARELREEGRAAELAGDLKRVEEHLAAARKGVDNIRRALAGGLLDLDEATAAALREARAREKALAARKKEIERELAAARAAEKTAKEALARARRWLREMDALGFEEKKALVRVLVRQVIIRGRGRSAEATVIANLGAAREAEMPRET